MSAVLESRQSVDFDGLYRHHAPVVYRYTYAVLGNHADAEDVTQQTFLNAYRSCAQGTTPQKTENWLLRIAHNEVRRHFRSKQRKPHPVELDEEIAQPATEGSDPSLADVLRALRQLPPTQRSVLVMREFEGRSYAEIAEITGMSQCALEATTFRARHALAQELEDALTCGEAEEAVLRRLDRRLPRRIARRLRVHLHECRACVRYADVQRRRRSLLKGLSVLPIPGSLFLFRAREAVASLGPTAGATGGTAAVGGGVAAAGSAGLAGGLAAKVAAVAAAATVAGGVGYGVTAAPSAVAKIDRTAPATVVAARRGGQAGTGVRTALAARVEPAAERRGVGASTSRSGSEASAQAKKFTAAPTVSLKARPSARGPAKPRENGSRGHQLHVAPGTTKTKARLGAKPAKAAAGLEVAKAQAAGAKVRSPKPGRAGVGPATPQARAKSEPTSPPGKAKPDDASPPGTTAPGAITASPPASGDKKQP